MPGAATLRGLEMFGPLDPAAWGSDDAASALEGDESSLLESHVVMNLLHALHGAGNLHGGGLLG